MIKPIALIFFAAFLCRCASLPPERISATLTDRSILLKKSPAFQEFLKLGPFNYETKEQYLIRVDAELLMSTDVFLPKVDAASPLIIIQHGNKADKRVHRLQAEHLASWGFNVITVEQPNENQWIENGHRLSELVKFLRHWPKAFPSDFIKDEIILVGHSFGGSAAAIAASRTRVQGVIFLDPALYHSKVEDHLKHIRSPAMLLAADRKVFYSKQRHKFYRLSPGGVTQVALKGATHEDAQYPSLTKVKYFLDPFTSNVNQLHFMAALTASAFSLSKQGDFSYAWESMRIYQARDEDRFTGFRRRSGRSFQRRG